jgi:hypothetical protein
LLALLWLTQITFRRCFLSRRRLIIAAGTSTPSLLVIKSLSSRTPFALGASSSTPAHQNVSFLTTQHFLQQDPHFTPPITSPLLPGDSVALLLNSTTESSIFHSFLPPFQLPS